MISWGVARFLPLIVHLAIGFMSLFDFSRKSSGGGVARASCLASQVCENVRTLDHCEFCEPSNCI